MEQEPDSFSSRFGTCGIRLGLLIVLLVGGLLAAMDFNELFKKPLEEVLSENKNQRNVRTCGEQRI
jgi:hypothetical protein